MIRYADMHCDTLMLSFFHGEERVFHTEDGMQSIELMHEAGQLLQFFAVFFPPRPEEESPAAQAPGRKPGDAPGADRQSPAAQAPGKKPGDALEAAKAQEPQLPPDDEYFSLLKGNLLRQVSLHSDIIGMACTAQDVRKNAAAGKASAVLTIEDGRLVQGSMERLAWLKSEGVAAIGLTWNRENCFGFPNSRSPELMQKGLTAFGKEAIAEMNRLGILVDVSHLSDGGFYDVARLSTRPFIASHSNCRAINPHPRNLTDDMIRCIAGAGGVAGLNFYPVFVSPDGEEETAEYLAAHVLHMMKVGGEDVIAIGTDFDGGDGKMEIRRPAQMELLFDVLKKKGLTARQLDKLASGNVLRVMEECI